MSYRLIDSNMLADRYPEVNDMPCIYLDLPNGLDNQHHGTVLPKGHGRLIDADSACEGNCAECPVNDICIVNKAPTIIEADKED